MAESQKRQSTLFAFLPNQSTKESSKESTESSSSYGKKKGKVLAKQDYQKKRKRNDIRFRFRRKKLLARLKMSLKRKKHLNVFESIKSSYLQGLGIR